MLALTILAIAASSVELPRTPVALVFVAVAPSRDARRFEDAWVAALEGESRLGVLRLDPGLGPSCGGDLACVAREARRRGAARGLVVTSFFPAPVGGRAALLSAVLDLEAPSDAALVHEDRDPLPADPSGLAAAAAAVRRALAGVLGPAELVAPGVLSLELGPVPGAVRLDGQPVGADAAGALRIANVAAGEHAVSVERDGGTIELVFTMAPGGEASLSAAVAERAIGPAVAWTGVALAAVGVGVTIAAVLRASGATTTEACLRLPAQAGCARPGFIAVGYDPARPDDPGAGPLMAPLGLSLIAGGGGLALGAGLLEEGEPPWWSLAIGVGLGALTYGVLAAVDGGR